MHKHSGYSRVGAYDSAMGLGRSGHCKTDTSHASTDIAPHAMFIVDFAKHMMPHHVHGTRRFWSNKAANDTLSCKRGTQIVGLEIIGEHVVEAAKHEAAINIFVLAPKSCREVSNRRRFL